MTASWLALLALPPALIAGWTGLSHAWHARWHRRSGTPTPRLGATGFAAYHLREMAAFARLGAWHVRAWFADGLRRPAATRGRPVLFVHGFTQNGTNGWGLRRRLERLGRPTAAVSLGPPFRSVAEHARPLVATLRGMAEQFPEGIDVVAHSMGGIVLRRVLADHPDLARHVRRVVTLGTPHRGTAGARGAPPGLSVDVSELARGSTLLRELPDLSVLAPHAAITTVAATTDLIVYPASSCHDPGARAIDLDGVGHAGLLAWARVHDVVIEALVEPAVAQAAK